ncbi:peptidase [Micromonospora craterilacus]|uniref:Peptidase n=1 Tax=Micromonospora craterilacus TaxID=1655439 RepID=A0A2W2EGU0_9ACTN|nr:peptidase [Micromonospora craterilacus]PZG12830.1 peptidase [Micromonospora craterilacus]
MPLVSVALLATGVPAAPAVAAHEQQAAGRDQEGIGIRLVDIPAARVNDPRARVYIIDHVKPGATVSRRIEVSNGSPDRQEVELYAGGATIEENTFTVPEGHGGNELSGWISLGSASLDLAPGQSRQVEVDIEVPRTASKGERYGAIWAPVSSAPKRNGNVIQVHRVGLRLYLDVGPGGEPPTDFRVDDVAAEPGPGEFPLVTARVTNTGGRALDMTGTLTLTKGPVRAGPFKVTNGVTILPGQSGRVQIEVDQSLPAGVWDVRLVLTSGVVERTAEGRITLPVATRAAMQSSTPGWLVYSLGTLVALAALGVFAAWLFARRRSSRREVDRQPA